jgi:hypothetical protein
MGSGRLARAFFEAHGRGDLDAVPPSGDFWS